MTTNHLPDRKRSLPLIGGCLLISLLAALIAGAAGEATSRNRDHRLEIEQMTPAQRAQLDRNFARFQQMSPAEQQEIRRLHHELQTASDAAELQLTLDRYRAWLKTLSPFQREDLRSIADSDLRAERVRELKEQQSAPEPLSDEAPRLSPADLAAMMNAIAKELDIPAADLEDKTGLARHLFILNALADSKRDHNRGRDWTASLFDDQLMSNMTAALPDGDFRTAIADLHRFKNEERRIVARNIFEMLSTDVRAQLAAGPPPPADLTQLLDRLDPDDVRRYERLESDEDRQEFLQQRFRFLRLQDEFRPYPALRPFMFQLAFWGGGFDPRRNNGSFPRRGGRRGDDEGRPEERQGPPPDAPPPDGPPRERRPGDKNGPRAGGDRPDRSEAR